MTKDCAFIPVSAWKPPLRFPRKWCCTGSCSGSSLRSPGQEQLHRRVQVQTPHDCLVLNRQRLVQSMRSRAEQQVRTANFGAEGRARKPAGPIFRKNQASYVSLPVQEPPEAWPCSALSMCQVLPKPLRSEPPTQARLLHLIFFFLLRVPYTSKKQENGRWSTNLYLKRSPKPILKSLCRITPWGRTHRLREAS